MPKNRTFTLSGEKKVLKALRKKMDELEDGLEEIAHAAASPIRDAAEAMAPQRTGNLADHIEQETLSKSEDEAVVGVGPDDKEAFYGFFVEFGTGEHEVERDRARGIEVDNDEFRANAQHPGARGRPFLRPAYDQNKDLAVKKAGERLKDILDL